MVAIIASSTAVGGEQPVAGRRGFVSASPIVSTVIVPKVVNELGGVPCRGAGGDFTGGGLARLGSVTCRLEGLGGRLFLIVCKRRIIVKGFERV